MFTNGESGELQTYNQISLYFENFRMITINIFNHAALHVPGAVIAQVQYDLKKDTMRRSRCLTSHHFFAKLRYGISRGI